MFKHSVCRWCYQALPLDDLCAAAVELEIHSIDLVTPIDMPLLQKHGLTCAMIANPTTVAENGTTVGVIEKAWNRVEYHDVLLERYVAYLREAAAA